MNPNDQPLTDTQRSYILKVLKYLDQGPEVVIDALTKRSAAQVIDELKLRADRKAGDGA